MSTLATPSRRLAYDPSKLWPASLATKPASTTPARVRPLSTLTSHPVPSAHRHKAKVKPRKRSVLVLSSPRTRARSPPPPPPRSRDQVRLRPSPFGMGLFARRSFLPGDIITSESPLFTARRAARAAELLADARVRAHAEQLLAFTTAEGAGATAVEAVFRANSIPCVGEEHDDAHPDTPYGLFKYVSRCNSSCAPNAGYFWCTETRRMLLIAYTSIPRRTEITAAYRGGYAPLCQTRSARRTDLLSQHGFECGCCVCVRGSGRSDRRRERLSVLLRRWENVDDVIRDKDQTVRETEEAGRIAEKEGLVAVLVYIHTARFYALAAWADTGAKAAAQAALDALVRIRGRRAAGRHWIAECAVDPKAWGSYGICKQ